MTGFFNEMAKRNYFFLLALLDALSGLIFWASLISILMCEALGQFPVIHLLLGSGYTLQYFPDS